eukprot:TRINITY_DN2049_c0_g2_i5.p1 TRINITY_DN2049_c0_g2~~TRINITY_DN2049_c0_g2_i5.p1  ORF type:complete len:133 (+),score=15.60 TRINITY_DN2049_c0_g2_i5:219-617(+)
MTEVLRGSFFRIFVKHNTAFWIVRCIWVEKLQIQESERAVQEWCFVATAEYDVSAANAEYDVSTATAANDVSAAVADVFHTANSISKFFHAQFLSPHNRRLRLTRFRSSPIQVPARDLDGFLPHKGFRHLIN